MKVTIDNVYSICGKRIVRNITSCGRFLISVTRLDDGDIRIVLGLTSIWISGRGQGLVIGDPSYWTSYDDCPTIWIRLCRWIGFRTGAFPNRFRPEVE